ncbi:hypothetical protein EB796_014464 [Bugula neritina]|uniref:Copper type II ascorbate-dependent monooxygenase C-terminal domain-containing protein n=1 Tax=Bugula neritina TaxID=10212 RepID=A0A7J7JP81_BUGNE|nr:hypothetical protein EB796_014464 [Bugula neritina]
MFYQVSHSGMSIQEGDIIAARCTMNSVSRTENTIIGPSNHDEMCNFYFMYHTEEGTNLEDTYCFKDAQSFHWSDYFDDTVIPEDVSNLWGVHLVDEDMEPVDQHFMF